MTNLERAHDRQLIRKGAFPGNLGWVKDGSGIASKTDRGILVTTRLSSGRYQHVWKDSRDDYEIFLSDRWWNWRTDSAYQRAMKGIAYKPPCAMRRISVALKASEVRKTLHGWRYGTQSGRDIITIFCNPPIPIRDQDWTAYQDGDDEKPQWYGWGKTEQDALADWRRIKQEQYEHEHERQLEDE